MPFRSKGVHTVTSESGLFELTEVVSYHSRKFDEFVTVPIGFKTDFASIPRIARVLINRNGKSREAAVVHDYLYKRHIYSRKIADHIFLEAMQDSDVNVFVRRSMYMAVRAGGWIFFNKNQFE